LYDDFTEVMLGTDPNDPDDVPETTITLPPDTVTTNITVTNNYTTTLESGIAIGVTVGSVGVILTVAVMVSRRVKKK
jgi:hypothetical protein